MADNLLLAAIENDEDLLLLSFSRKEESAISYQRLDIEKLTNDQCRTMFRFDRDDIKILCHALKIPEKIICEKIICENRTTATNIEGLCIVLRRLAYPCRLDDLEPVFGKSKAEISHIFNYLLDFLYTMHSHLLSDLNRSWLSQEHLEEFANSVSARNAPLDNCWGLIDGTVRPICRPQQNQ